MACSLWWSVQGMMVGLPLWLGFTWITLPAGTKGGRTWAFLSVLDLGQKGIGEGLGLRSVSLQKQKVQLDSLLYSANFSSFCFVFFPKPTSIYSIHDKQIQHNKIYHNSNHFSVSQEIDHPCHYWLSHGLCNWSLVSLMSS